MSETSHNQPSFKTFRETIAMAVPINFEAMKWSAMLATAKYSGFLELDGSILHSHLLEKEETLRRVTAYTNIILLIIILLVENVLPSDPLW